MDRMQGESGDEYLMRYFLEGDAGIFDERSWPPEIFALYRRGYQMWEAWERGVVRRDRYGRTAKQHSDIMRGKCDPIGDGLET